MTERVNRFVVLVGAIAVEVVEVLLALDVLHACRPRIEVGIDDGLQVATVVKLLVAIRINSNKALEALRAHGAEK